MTKFILTSFLLLAATILLTAQTETTKVKIHLKNGKTTEVLVGMNTDKPWNYQDGLVAIPLELRNAEKIRKKDYITFKAKSIEAYEFNGRYFKSMKVAINAREEGSSQLAMIPRYQLLERVQEGAITVYTGYPTPKGGLGDKQAEIYADHRDNPDYFVKKASMKKTKNLTMVNIEKLIKDCPEVHNKYRDGAYGNHAMKEGKKLGNLMRKVENNNENSSKIAMIADYNTIMSARASK